MALCQGKAFSLSLQCTLRLLAFVRMTGSISPAGVASPFFIRSCGQTSSKAANTLTRTHLAVILVASVTCQFRAWLHRD